MRKGRENLIKKINMKTNNRNTLVTFTLDDEQLKKLTEWWDNRPKKNEGCSGGRYVYMICPTTLGTVLKVRDDITKEEIDLTDYNW